MMSKHRHITASLLIIASILLVTQINPVFSYEVSSMTLTVNIDGSVEITQLLRYITPGINITIPLLGDPLYIEVTSDGLPQPILIQDNKLIIVEPMGEELSIKYIVPNLTNKTGEEWSLSFTSPWEIGVALPDEAIILDVTPETFDVNIVNNTVLLIFPPGEVNVKYVLLPSTGAQPPEGTYPPLGMEGGGIIPLLLILVIILMSSYIIYRYLIKRKKIQIVKSELDERDTQIINILASYGELSAKEIMDKTRIPKTPLYRRLKRLVKQGYIEQRTVGGVTYYRIKKE